MLTGAAEGNTACKQPATLFVSWFAYFCPSYYFPGSRFAMQKKGYFTAEMFSDVVKHIIENTDGNQKLLILDGHDSHFHPEAIDM